MAESSETFQGQQASDASQGGEGVNFEALFSQTQQDLESTKQTAAETARELDGVKNQSKTANETIERMKAALMGEDGAEPSDPVEEHVASLEAQMDEYLQAAIDAERKGTPIPLTINSAINSLKHQISYARENKELKAQLAKMDNQIKGLSNPQTAIDNMAYSNMDSHIMGALDTIYGPGDEYKDVKAAQFDTVMRQVADEVKNLQHVDKQMWDRVRRDKNAQVKLVNHYVQKNIPPRARQLLEEDTIRREPMSTDELTEAWREAKELAKTDPSAEKYVVELRRELLARVYQKSAGKSGRLNSSALVE